MKHQLSNKKHYHVPKPRVYVETKAERRARRKVLIIMLIAILSLTAIGILTGCDNSKYTEDKTHYMVFTEHQLVLKSYETLTFHKDTVWNGNRRAVINWDVHTKYVKYIHTDSCTLFSVPVEELKLRSMTIIPASCTL